MPYTPVFACTFCGVYSEGFGTPRRLYSWGFAKGGGSLYRRCCLDCYQKVRSRAESIEECAELIYRIGKANPRVFRVLSHAA
jgi:hypothetical protein